MLFFRVNMVSVCAFFNIWQHDWEWQDETSPLKSFPYIQNVFLTSDTLVAIAWRWRLQCARAEVPSCATLIQSPCELGGCLVHALSINPSTPHFDYKPFSGIHTLPNKLRWSLANLMGRLGWSRHELMLQVAVPASFPHSSCKVPFAWHV